MILEPTDTDKLVNPDNLPLQEWAEPLAKYLPFQQLQPGCAFYNNERTGLGFLVMEDGRMCASFVMAEPILT